jgi:DNA repair protein RecO (recombination protein O)
MLVKTKAFVLSALKYQEKSLIVKCFTYSDGLKSYFVPNAYSGKKSNQKIAYFQPLTLLEIEAVHKNKGTLEHFREIKLAAAYQTIPMDIVKSTIVIFLSEILHHSIREEAKNTSLFDLIESALLWLDAHDEIANFHLILLLEVTKYLGFYPESSLSTDPFFELTEVDLRQIEVRIDNIQNGVIEFEDCGNVKLPIDFNTILGELTNFRDVVDDQNIEEQVKSLENIFNSL